jgi:hypothetical protein
MDLVDDPQIQLQKMPLRSPVSPSPFPKTVVLSMVTVRA